MSTHAVSLATPRAARLLGPAFTIGGLLWIGDFVQIVANGLISGTLADGPMSTTEIATAMGITPSGCYKGLCRMEKRGIIKRLGVVDHRRHGGQSCIVWSRA